jgi:hypothetical protein
MKNIVNKIRMQEQLVNAVRFTKNNALNSDKIGDDFSAWKSIASTVQPYAYKVYEAMENHEDTTAPMSALIENGIKPMLAELGTLKLYDKDGTAHDVAITIDDNFKTALANVCANYAGKMGKKESTELGFVRSQLNNVSRTLRDYEGKNGINPEAIESLREQKEQHEARIAELLATPDESVPEPVPVGDASFRKALEVHMGRTLTQQRAKTWEQYQEEKEAKRKERRAATKAKKAEAKKSA